MQNLVKKVGVIFASLVLAQTVSVYFHGLSSDSAAFLFMWFYFLVLILPVNLTIYYLLISGRHLQISLRELFFVCFFVHIIAIEPVLVFLEITSIDLEVMVFYLLIFAIFPVGLLLAFLVSRLPKTFSFASIYRWMIVIPVFYAVLYFISPSNAVDICRKIKVDMSEEQVMNLIEQEALKVDVRNLYSTEKDNRGIRTIKFMTTRPIGQFHCRVELNEIGNVVTAGASQEP